MTEKRNNSGKNYSFEIIRDEKGARYRIEIPIKAESENEACNCCGRPVSELTPWRIHIEEGKDEVEIWFLSKEWRPYWLLTQDEKKVLGEFEEIEKLVGFDMATEWLIQTFGKEKADDLGLLFQGATDPFESFECLDCARLSDADFLKKYCERIELEKLLDGLTTEGVQG